jgi:hypothetical protein
MSKLWYNDWENLQCFSFTMHYSTSSSDHPQPYLIKPLISNIKGCIMQYNMNHNVLHLLLTGKYRIKHYHCDLSILRYQGYCISYILYKSFCTFQIYVSEFYVLHCMISIFTFNGPLAFFMLCILLSQYARTQKRLATRLIFYMFPYTALTLLSIKCMMYTLKLLFCCICSY